MIKNRKEYKYYVHCDEKVNIRGKHTPFYVGDEIKKYLKIVRKRELIDGYKKKFPKFKYIFSLYGFLLKWRCHNLGVKLGFSIPINVVGKGLRIDHYGFVVINEHAKVGDFCSIYGDVTIGVKGNNNSTQAPIIGNNVTIGSGARILGNVTIPDGCVVGANAVVVHDVSGKNKVVAGIPAKEIKDVS